MSSIHNNKGDPQWLQYTVNTDANSDTEIATRYSFRMDDLEYAFTKTQHLKILLVGPHTVKTKIIIINGEKL